MTAPRAAAASGTVIIEPERRSSMMVSLCLQLRVLQRIGFGAPEVRGAVFCCRVGASALRKGKLFQARSPQQPRKTIVSFDAARFGIKSVLLVTQLDEVLLGGPRACPHGRIFDGDGVLERVWPGPGPALDEVQVLPRALIIGLWTEVRYVNDEGVAIPVATGVAIPLADIGRQM